jgi:RNA polymerase sigma-70 factor (ECF subfamily)
MWRAKIRPVTRPDDEPDALDELLQSAYRYALSLAHDPAAAEDLVQEACISVLSTGASWRKPYLFTTIRNRFIDHYRRNRRVLFVPLDSGDEPAAAEEDRWLDELPDVLQSGALDRALGVLRVEERETLYLAIVEGYTAQEIADFTNRPRGTVLSLLHRTKRKLRKILRQEPGS